MTDDFLRFRIVHIKTEIPGANSYFLEPVNGQPVPYRAGQFLTLIVQHGGHEVRRSYSLSSAPDEPLRLTIKRVENGEISRYLLDTLRVGDVLTSLHPAGRFTLDDAHTGESTAPGLSDRLGDLILFGAGSGITPLFGILKQALRTQPDRRVTLLYSNSTEQSIIFRDELADLQCHFADRFHLIHLLSNASDDWPGRRGRLNNVMLERLLPELVGRSDRTNLQFYVCGPGDYRRMIQFTLVFGGIRPEQIKREDFVIKPVVLTPPPALAVDRTVLLRLHRRGLGGDQEFNNQERTIQVPAYTSILQAALDEGVQLPYSCRGGRCSTCVARCTSGSVHMTINDVLTERDLAEGWMLTCTGYPETDGVVIDV